MSKTSNKLSKSSPDLPDSGIVIPKLKNKKEDKIRKAYLKGCKGKIKYDSAGHASWSLKDMVSSGMVATNEKMNVYLCRFCKHWHIGHKETYAEPQIIELIQNMINDLDTVLVESC